MFQWFRPKIMASNVSQLDDPPSENCCVRGKPTGQFMRNRVKRGPVEPDWFVKPRAGLNLMRQRHSR
jgi:hypothetical protein